MANAMGGAFCSAILAMYQDGPGSPPSLQGVMSAERGGAMSAAAMPEEGSYRSGRRASSGQVAPARTASDWAVCRSGGGICSGALQMTAVQYQIPVIWIIFDDEEFKLIKLYQLEAYHETGLVEFQNPDFAAYARACGADGYRVDTLEQFEDAYRAALGSGRPSVIDAKITRWAVPHHSPSPHGIVAGLVEAIEARFRSG